MPYRSVRSLLVAVSAACVVLAPTLPLAAITLSFTKFADPNVVAGLSSKGAIGFTFAGNKFVGSVYSGGQLYSTDLSGGSVAAFGPSGVLNAGIFEHYVASSYGLGGFPSRDIYVGDLHGNENSIVHITNDGTSHDKFVGGMCGSPNSLCGAVRGILFDSIGTFGNNMLVATSLGNIYQITASGAVTLLANVTEDAEGMDIIPPNANFGPFAGQLIVASESSGLLRAISPGGVVTKLNPGNPIYHAEVVSFVPLNLGASGSALEGYYEANYSLTTNTAVFKVAPSQFTSLKGDLIVSGELGVGQPLVTDVHWNGTSFVQTQVGVFPPQPEDGFFLTAAILEASPCLQLQKESVLCATDSVGDYLYSFQVTNLSTTTAYHLLLLNLPPPATATPDDITFPGGLAPGQTSPVETVRIHGAHPGTFPFLFGLFDNNVQQCCAFSHSIELPACNCAQVLSDQVCTAGASGFTYTFTIQDLRVAPPVSYALVTATTPGLVITQSGAPIVPALGYGGTTTQTVGFSGPAATPGATVCFMLSVHDASLAQCCSIDRCATLPLSGGQSPGCIFNAHAPDLDVTLNTGINPASPGAPQPDPNWTVIVPRPAQAAQSILWPDLDWPWAIPGTTWISRQPDAAAVAGVSAIRYRRCFCVGAGAQEATLDLSLWADDRASLLLNGAPIAGPGGHYAAADPLSVHLTSAVGGSGLFKAGVNCLVAVVHESGSTTGLDVFGSIKAAGGACVPP